MNNHRPIAKLILWLESKTTSFLSFAFILSTLTLSYGQAEYPALTDAVIDPVSGNYSGTGTFTCPSMPDFTYLVSGDLADGDTNVPNTSQILNNGGAFETLFGEADMQPNIEVEVASVMGTAGDPITNTVMTTISFTGPTPPGQFGFAIADVEQDQVIISATDANNMPVPPSVIDSWFVEVFDANDNADGSNPPTWDGNNATLVGEFAPAGVQQTVYQDELPDNEAGAASFIVSSSITQLVFESQALGLFMDDPSQHFFLASTCEEPQCPAIGADPTEFCAYIIANPASTVATEDCDMGGISNLIECQNGENPLDPADDCQAAIDGAVDICAILLANPASVLANQDCDNGGVSNADECAIGGNPSDPADDNPCPVPNCSNIGITQN